MGDTQNCQVANDIPKVPIDMSQRKQEKRNNSTDAEGNKGSFIMRD